MRKSTFLLAFLLSSFSSLFAQPADYLFIVDLNLSPYMGAEDFLSVHHELERLEERIFTQHCSPKKNFGARLGRLGELVLLWWPINETMMLVQHEFFGHGYRIRSLGSKYAEVKGYKIGVPPPYGPGGGATHLHITHRLTTSQEMAIDSGGVEANAIFANRIKLKWLQKGSVDPKEASLYLETEHDLTQYVWSLDDTHWLDFEHGHDIESYLFWLHATYPEAHLSKRQLKIRSLVNFLDPFTYYAVYSWFRYIGSGENTSIPMLCIKNIQYLPGARLGLTPFGPEYYLENFFVKEEKPFYVYLRGGHYAKNTFWGLGVEGDRVWEWERAYLGFRFDLWRQPHYSSQRVFSFLEKIEERFIPDSEGSHQMRFGAAFSLIGAYPCGESPISLYAQLGYKSIGFLPGESLQAAPIARIGISARY